jgi:hypothetical protein
MLKKSICFGGMGLAIVCMLFTVRIVKDAGHLTTGQSSVNPVDRLEAPGSTDLGAVDIGEMVQASIKIRNRSGSEVLVNRFKPDCSCTDVYVERGGSRGRVVELLLKPGESEVVHLDIKISGEPGLKQVSSLEFREADRPDFAYHVSIFHTPVAHFYSVPRVALFGEVRVGEAETRRIALRSNGKFPRPLEGVTMLSSPEFSMRFSLPADADLASDSLKGQGFLGFAEVTYTPSGEARDVREELTFLANGEALGKAAATAIVVADYSIAPKTLVLPRYESDRPVYTGTLICRSRSGRPFTILPEPNSPELRVTVEPGDDPSSSVKIGVAYLGSPLASSTTAFDLNFKIKDESGERPIRSRVIIGPVDP